MGGKAAALSIALKPIWVDGTVKNMKVNIEINYLSTIGPEVLTMTRCAASIPCCEPEGLCAQDGNGEVPLAYEEVGTPVPHVKKGVWRAGREVAGAVRVSYTVSTRVLPAGYSSSPYFDFRDEKGGASGAGWTFLVLPFGGEEDEWDYTITWDLSGMPAGCGAESTLGDGGVLQGSGNAEKLGFAYYAMGDLQCWRDENYPGFGFYWFGTPRYDIAQVAAYTKGLYEYMSAFFGEPGRPYKVFARKDPFPLSGGGTALPGGFMYGYSDAMDVTVESIQNLLSHEMVHNWPHLRGDDEESTWYHEGAAEYYSSVLPWRAGLIAAEQMREQFNKKVRENYYLNLHRGLSNDEAAQLYWKDRETQRLPYGRGLVYLTNMDAFIREHSGGRHSLDDVVLEILKLDRAGKLKGVGSWFEIVERCAGADPRPGYEAMKRGDLLVPREDTLGGLFEIAQKQEPLLDMGFDFAGTFAGEREGYPIQGLKAGSNAEKAGLREGDVVPVGMSRKEVVERKTDTVTVTVLRQGKEVGITYLPHGDLADVYYWAARE